MKSALILGRINGAGLDRDAALLSVALEAAGVETRCPPWKSLCAAFDASLRADAAIHLERVAPRWWKQKASIHILIPNQERYPLRLLGKLRRIDQVWCKTRHAAEIFAKHHPDVRYIGFTSEDCLLESIKPDYGKFIHLAGRSTFKNTALVLDLWQKHPEWPRLTLIQHPDNAPAKVPANIDLISRHLPDAELRELQNSHGIHLCPSISEGWGHYIVEAMSCRAVVVTTDAPPMNELIAADRGVFVQYNCSEPRHLGHNFFVDSMALEIAIQTLITKPQDEKQQLGVAARKWFDLNNVDFNTRLESSPILDPIHKSKSSC
jgi:glycosyltransferase involved in cell wall biosynthesis